MREAIFNLLINAHGNPVTGARVLDLFAGTGALGLEAISRGAAGATFVDDGKAALALLRANIAKLRAEVQLELRRLQRRIGKTFILVTHDQNEAMTVSDRIFVMCEGRIVQSGPPVEVYDRPVNRFVAEFLGTTNLIRAWRNNGTVHTEMGDLKPRAHPSWDNGVLAIRPERILVRRDRPEANGVRAVVSEVFYRGDRLDIYVQPLNLHLRSVPGTAHLKPGHEVWLELPTRHLEALGE